MAFRTPQHPSMGTNNWGGESPLLARNVPQESLEQRYLRLNSIRTRDEIFPAEDDDFFISCKGSATVRSFGPDSNHPNQRQYPVATPPAPASRRGLLSRLMIGRRREKKPPAQPPAAASATLGLRKKRWFEGDIVSIAWKKSAIPIVIGEFMAGKLNSSLRDLRYIPESYVLPPASRPHRDHGPVPFSASIPVIDLWEKRRSGSNHEETMRLILGAGQEFGFFQLVNDGLSERLLDEAMDVVREFFEMQDEDWALY
ncbi:hypothetical protein CRG98_019528 [Punica granatum]|uniref:Non-haem dioxygenase N-terminal domain-containing protein n=1 Tax=Punica granatum TaxID=22663 RepID=A0A2I0JW13_PUNGR|nr:hypothetical protein CRG98_019528 [Punica granatum]